MNTWNIAYAKTHFSSILKEMETKPQIISKRNKPVAVIMNMDQYNDSLADRSSDRSIQDMFQELRMIQKTEKKVIDIPKRRDREIAF